MVTDGGGSGGTNECVNVWEELECPPPASPVFTLALEGQDILWVDDPANATTVGPGGWLFGNLAVADSIGWIIGGDQTCGMACILPDTHPCSQESTPENPTQYCNPDPYNTGCLWCGPGEASDCATFASICLGVDPPSDGTTGGADDDGGADDESGGSAEGSVAPDVSLFTSNPDVLYGTTQTVTDILGPHTPANLSADDGCAQWDPSTAVQGWLDEPIVDKAAFNLLVDRAEAFLGRCDGLRLDLPESGGVALKSVGPQTLASELGFQAQDVILSLNGVSSTDVFGLRSEVMRLSAATDARARIVYRRGTVTRTRTIRIQ